MIQMNLGAELERFDDVKSSVSSKDICDIIETAINLCEVDGYFNPFGFKTIVYLYLAIYLYKDKAEDIRKSIQDDGVFAAYDRLLKDGTFKDMITNHAFELYLVEANAPECFEKYSTYVTSARGIMDGMSEVSGESIQEMLEKITSLSTGDNIKKVFDIAEKWNLD